MLSSTVLFSIRSILIGKNLLRSVNLRSKIKCRYTRWTSRTPIAIVNEHELFDNTDDTETKKIKKTKIQEEKTFTIQRRERTRTQKRKEKEKKNENKMGEPVITEQGYTYLKADDKFVSSLMIDVKTRNKRKKNNSMLLEGFRLIKDAVQAGTKPKAIFFNRLSDILPLSLSKKVKLYKVPYHTIQLWSNLTTSPGILGIFEIPDIVAKQPDDAIPLTIICDNIREPGNLGTIIRVAAAVGCEKLLLMKGCTDLWDSKVLRSAIGAHFRIPIHTSVLWHEIPTLISNESMIFLADNNIAYEDKLRDNTLNTESIVSTSIETDSNNIIQDNNDANSDQIVENNKKIDDAIDNLLAQTKSHKPTVKSKLLVKKLISQLPVEPYYTLDFTKRESVLVIGGETEGISLESCKLLHARNCVRINVPLTNGVDSLNVGVAVGIVTFEIKRQFLTQNINDE